MADKRDYYEVLGLQKGASADEIKAAYRKAALKWHPDRWVSGSDEEKKTAESKFKEASEAYSVLSDPDKKAKYDQFGFAGVDGAAGQDWSQGFGNLNESSTTSSEAHSEARSAASEVSEAATGKVRVPCADAISAPASDSPSRRSPSVVRKR